MNCSLTNEERKAGKLCRGLHCEPCKKFRIKEMVVSFDVLTATQKDFAKRKNKALLGDMATILFKGDVSGSPEMDEKCKKALALCQKEILKRMKAYDQKALNRE